MKPFYLLFCLTLLSSAVQAQKAVIIKSPAALPENTTRLKIFLGGSIDMGNAEDWQHAVETRLSDEEIILLNPRRDDWNKEWKPVSTDTHFRNQVEWELNALEKADIIIMFLAPGSQSPVSLLELGLYARTHKLMVVCPEGFWRKGNVDIVCEKYSIETYSELHILLEALKEKIRKHHG